MDKRIYIFIGTVPANHITAAAAGQKKNLQNCGNNRKRKTRNPVLRQHTALLPAASRARGRGTGFDVYQAEDTRSDAGVGARLQPRVWRRRRPWRNDHFPSSHLQTWRSVTGEGKKSRGRVWWVPLLFCELLSRGPLGPFPAAPADRSGRTQVRAARGPKASPDPLVLLFFTLSLTAAASPHRKPTKTGLLSSSLLAWTERASPSPSSRWSRFLQD